MQSPPFRGVPDRARCPARDGGAAEDRVVIVDDVTATGGTAVASIELVRQTGATITEYTSLIDLPALGGSDQIRRLHVPFRSLMNLGGDAE